MQKKCEGCGKMFSPGRWDTASKWKLRKFCKRACRNKIYSNTRPLEERFWEKVDKSGGPKACWPWMAATDTFGYGRVGVADQRVDGSNRVAWELTHGTIPKGKDHHGTCVLHKCDNPGCCNPNHLFLGSTKDNMQDMTIKGRHGRRKLNERDVKTIRKLDGRYAQSELAIMFGVSSGMISMIINRKSSDAHMIWDRDEQALYIFNALARIDRNVSKILSTLKLEETKMTAISDAIASLQTQVSANTDAEASAVALIQNLATLIQQNAGDPAAVNELAARLKASADVLGAAVTDNTPSA